MMTTCIFRINHRIILTVIFVLLHIFVQQAYTQSPPNPYKIRYLTVDDGLSHTDANDIAQDSRGFIWIATYFGLDRYDGYSIKRFYNSNEPLKNAYKNRLRCVFPDKEGNIWLGTEGGLQRFDARLETYFEYETDRSHGTFEKIFKPDNSDRLFGIQGGEFRMYRVSRKTITLLPLQPPEGIRIRDLVPGPDNLLYLATNQGVYTVDTAGRFRKIAFAGTANEDLSHLYLNREGQLLLSSGNKLFLTRTIQSSSGQILQVEKQYEGPGWRDIRNILQDEDRDYWVNDGNAMRRLDKSLNLVQSISSLNGPESLNSNALSAACIDRSQCLWICTFGGGVNYFDLHEKPFHTLRPNPEVANSISSNYVRAVLADSDSLWVGTTNDGLRLYDMKTGQATSYHGSGLRNITVTALTLDNDHNLWLGGNSGIEILRARSKDAWKPAGYADFPKNTIETLARDCFGNIWFGNHTDRFGVIWKDNAGDYHTRYYGEGFFILTDSLLPQLFVSSTQGLKRLIIDNKGNIVSQTTYRASSKPNSLSSDYTYPVAKRNDSTYWIGTIGGGLNCLVLHANGSHTITTYAGKYGIFNDVESMEIDNQGNIWIGGNGLECFNPTTLNLVKYDKNDGLQGNSFKVNSSYKGADGKLYFGGINGLNYFYPEQIQANKILSTPRITDILINNQHPVVGKGKDLQQAIGYINNITINHLQNNFVIFFSSMHYANPLKCRYRYKLVGFNDDWQYTDGKNPSAVYSNVDYKTYEFVVEATNDDGVWSTNTASIAITVTPPWWKSTVAKIIYSLLLFSLIAGIYIYQARWHKLKRDIAVREINERKREEMHRQREELHQQQLTFFTNISHEFRTPLTLILGPLETLIQENTDNRQDGLYKLMFRNAKRLMNLITELMNFRKVADSVIKLHLRPVNIYQFCADLAEDFENTALSRDLSFRFVNNTGKKPEELFANVDVQVLEKIISNLLNNAVKYTDINGEVTFEIFSDINTFKPSFENGFTLLHREHRAKSYLYFRIADTGIGISAESINQIFDRYYRISSNHLGSGIGLALVKHLTQLHKGDIYVYSERHTGTEIVIGIPWEASSYAEIEKAAASYENTPYLEPVDKSLLLSVPEFTPAKTVSTESDRKQVLIVEDNQELRMFLRETMERHYNIYEAENGEQGLEIAREKIPDLIISDVMMPKMGGLAFCKAIKEKFETSHIPFIILSAKDALDTKIEGLESGADIYFAKPLSIELLLLTIQNLFRQQDTLRSRYTENYLLEAAELVQSEKDKDFLNILVKLIEDNMQDADLDVDFLCRNLHVSRTKLYQKIKSVSGQSVGEFIRTVRLKKSVHLMTHEGISMSEVAYRVGMQSSSNFSRAFKKEYGKSPLQFMQALKGHKDKMG